MIGDLVRNNCPKSNDGQRGSLRYLLCAVENFAWLRGWKKFVAVSKASETLAGAARAVVISRYFPHYKEQ